MAIAESKDVNPGCSKLLTKHEVSYCSAAVAMNFSCKLLRYCSVKTVEAN